MSFAWMGTAPMPFIPPLWAQLYLIAPVVTLLLWGGLTVTVMRLNRNGPGPGRIALLLAIPLLFLAHQQLWLTRDDLTVFGSYRAFVAGLLIWAWHELAFYSAVLTGPWQKPCPPDARGWSRFWYALGTHGYHECAVALELVVLATLVQGGTNQIGLLVVGLSWALQHSAKLNVFLGVPRLQIELFPVHLSYLGSFWCRRNTNPFLLPSLLVGTALMAWFWNRSTELTLAQGATGMALLGVLTSLGLLEHLLLILPGPKEGFSSPKSPLVVTDPESLRH
jgi:putative photosynthetic complex assembly protein 2